MGNAFAWSPTTQCLEINLRAWTAAREELLEPEGGQGEEEGPLVPGGVCGYS